MDPDTSAEQIEGPAYAGFARRMQALVTDAAVVGSGLAILVVLSPFVEKVPGSGRAMAIAILGLMILYEPIFVWRRGATLGHRHANIQVVSDVSGGPPSFPAAFARFWIKAFLGLPSFVMMFLTRRHQAFHDIITGTTVQICDPELSSPEDVVEEHVDADDATRAGVPAWRRAVGIVVYLIVSYVAFGVCMALVLRPECLRDDMRCSRSEQVVETLIGVVWLALAMALLVFGWRGRLPGFRGASVSASPP